MVRSYLAKPVWMQTAPTEAPMPGNEPMAACCPACCRADTEATEVVEYGTCSYASGPPLLFRSCCGRVCRAGQVVVGTCAAAGHPRLKHKRFRMLVVDEASQITEPVSLIGLVLPPPRSRPLLPSPATPHPSSDQSALSPCSPPTFQLLHRRHYFVSPELANLRIRSEASGVTCRCTMTAYLRPAPAVSRRCRHSS